MPLYTDQLNRKVDIPFPPKRIISLVPSQTELLYDLGLDEQVVGITKFCIHPREWFRKKQRIGGTKTLHLQMIRSLQPDLIIANKEENVQLQVEELALEFPVWVSDVNNLEEAFKMMQEIGDITGAGKNAAALVSEIKAAFAQLHIPKIKPKTAYLIWKDPYMTVGGDTFIHHLLQTAGFENIFANRQRYPVITVEELAAANCPLVFLSSEPFPFKQKHVNELQDLLPGTTIILVDGEMFSWYGSRLLQSSAYFQHLQMQFLQ